MGIESGVTAASIDPKTIRKLRIKILPFLFFLYVVAYLDRTNIGFAALTMNRDLNINSRQYGLLVGIFFFGYFLFEIPSNLLLHKIGARIWIARILISWGIVAMLTGIVRTVVHLYIARFLLGVAEAGFFPGIILYLTYWFPQREQARAIAFFVAALPITSILGAPISGIVLDHVHWLGISSWRWLLILEGLPAILGGVLTYFLLPSRPEEADFLTPEEKQSISAALAAEGEHKRKKHDISATQALGDGRVWHLAAIGFTMTVGLYSISFWMPQLVKSLSSHYSNTVVGLLVTIPNIAGLISMVLVSRSSDRKLERRYHAAIPAIVGGMALLLLGTTSSPQLSIVLLSLVTLGIYSFYGPFFSLPSEFLTGFSAASGIALINSIGNLGGFVGPYAIGAIVARTGSLSGGLAVIGISLFASATLLLFLNIERKRLAE
jgi:ACS family tartrate transporter-like MFS transporter